MTYRPLARISSFVASRRLRLALFWTIGIITVLGLIGFLAGPPLMKSILEDKLGEALHRKVTIERVYFNPFTLEAQLGGLSARSAEGKEVFGLDSVHVDVQAESLTQKGLVIRELRLEAPRLEITRIKEGVYDISDLIDEWSKPSDPESPPPRFSISNIQLSGGRITFHDRPKGSTHTLTDIALRLPFLSSLPYQADIFVEPHFSARINGAPIALAGRSKPFAESHESELNLDLDRVELQPYLRYLPAKLPFILGSGQFDSEMKLLFKQSHGKDSTLELVGNLHVRDLVLKEEGGAPLLAWRRADIAIRAADLLRRKFAIDSVRIMGPNAVIRTDPQGALNLAQIAERLAGPSSPAANPVANHARGYGAPPAALTWSVGELHIEGGALRYQDQRWPKQPEQVIDHIDATVKGLSSDAAKPMTVNVAGRANEAGSLKASGDIRSAPMNASLDIEIGSLPLLPLQPYFGEKLNVILTSGQLSGKGRLDLQSGQDGLAGNFKGNITLGDLTSVDKGNGADFLRWKSLFVGDIDARLQPFALSVGEVALSDFFARLLINPQGKLNLTQLIRTESPVPPPQPTASGKNKAEAVIPSRPTPPPPIRIGKVSLQGGTVNFSDQFVKPNYTVNVSRIGGRITGLSSAANTVADLELRGTYGSGAPVEVRGRLNPLAATTFLDIKGEIRGVDLTTLSTYSRKYAGYAIEEGKLSLYVTYKLDNNRLTAENRVFLDQLTFGEAASGPAATNLPVKLAVALLKNSRGEIDINLPISGSLNDPDFSLGGIIVRVISNLVVKTVTSPFTFLGSLFGGGEELSSVDFDPGRTALGAHAIKRLEALAKAMASRPALKLEITGRADRETDREGLKRVALERSVRAEKQKDLAKKGRSPDKVELSPDEYPTYLQRAYKEAQFPKPRNLVGLAKALPVEEMERLMLANLAVTDDDLRQLAEDRAATVQTWLLEQGKVPMERLFILAPKLGGEERGEKKGSPSRVDFSLR